MAIESPYPYFTVHELVCQGSDCGCDHGLHMDREFMEKIVAMRMELGFPFIVHSAYRCPVHNNQVSKTGFDGPHASGRAIDIAVSGTRAHALVHCANQHFITGIGVNQKGPHNQRFIHLDDLQGDLRPWIWSY